MTTIPVHHNNESTFHRCPHDKKNPYVMISREMAQDRSISPKAKGVLLYLLSLPSDWKIYHSQLQEGLGIGEDYLNSALEELIINGYAERSREKIKGIFQPYKYIIREFKKSLPDRENQPGSSGPENPAIQNTDIKNKHDDDARTHARNICKDDVHFFCLKAKKDWASDEIDKAWDAYLRYSGNIEHPLEYIEAIIIKNRNLTPPKNLKEKSCSQKQEIIENETMQERRKKCVQKYLDLGIKIKHSET